MADIKTQDTMADPAEYLPPAPPGIAWSFYALDEDRSWGWSNHVWSLGFICEGIGNEPEDAWRQALADGQVPNAFLDDDPDAEWDVAIPSNAERKQSA